MGQEGKYEKHKAQDLEESQSPRFSESVNKENVFCLKTNVVVLRNAGVGYAALVTLAEWQSTDVFTLPI